MRVFLLMTCLTMFMAVAAAAFAAAEKDQVVALLQEVTVNRDTILLSDLLPGNSGDAFRDALEMEPDAIRLGRAPEPGSHRILEASQIAQLLASRPVLLSRLAIPSRILIRRLGWPISSGAIRAAIAGFLQQSGSKYVLADSAPLSVAAVGSRQPAPRLEVTGVSRLGEGYIGEGHINDRQQISEFRLRCVARSSCNSFLVRANVSADPASAAEAKPHPGMTPALPLPGVEGARPGLAVTLAEAGKPATLILDSAGMRISVKVICLERGVLKQRVRVWDAKARKIFRAEVAGPNLLHTTL